MSQSSCMETRTLAKDLTLLGWKIEARAELDQLGEGAAGSERGGLQCTVPTSQEPVSPLPCRTSTSSASRQHWNTWAVLIIMQHKPWAPPDTSALRQVPWM